MPHSPIVPADIDKRFRWTIVEIAKNCAELPEALTRELEDLLETDVRPEAWNESRDTLDDFREVIVRAAKVADELARYVGYYQLPQIGFIKWLGASGWGNDIRLIKLFDAWYQEAQRRKTLRRIRTLNS